MNIKEKDILYTLLNVMVVLTLFLISTGLGGLFLLMGIILIFADAYWYYKRILSRYELVEIQRTKKPKKKKKKK